MALEMDDENEEGGGGAPEWMVTFSDLVTLLLTFFVLLFSMSTVDAKKFTAASSSIRESFGGTQTSNVYSEFIQDGEAAEILEMVKMKNELIESQQAVYNDIRSFITENGMDGKVGAIIEEGLITLRVPGGLLFEEGSEELTAGGIESLTTLNEFFKTHREQFINIKGYSDNSPVPSNARFKDNWELSALRAMNVLRWLLDQDVPATRMTATGLGELDPILPNDTEEHRAKNRRVEFVMERKVGV